jgi:hypothetical protein
MYVTGHYKMIHALPSAGLQKVRLRRVEPLFPIGIWNLHNLHSAKRMKKNHKGLPEQALQFLS